MTTDLKRLGDRNQREKEDTSGYLHRGGECYRQYYRQLAWHWVGWGSMTRRRYNCIFWGFGLVQSEIGMIYSNSRKTALHFMFIDLPASSSAPRPGPMPGRAPRAQAEPSILHAHRIILLPLVDEESAVLFDQPLVLRCSSSWYLSTFLHSLIVGRKHATSTFQGRPSAALPFCLIRDCMRRRARWPGR